MNLIVTMMNDDSTFLPDDDSSADIDQDKSNKSEDAEVNNQSKSDEHIECDSNNRPIRLYCGQREFLEMNMEGQTYGNWTNVYMTQRNTLCKE